MKAFVIAGEVSGDKLGGALMAGLKHLSPDVEFQGIGGALMAEQGLDSLFPMDELSVMGLVEILPKYRALVARINQTVEAVIAAKPDVLITIDSPDFCLRVARKVKERSDIRCVHYVAPTVWAWRAGRAAKMAKYIDHVLALFPFEPPYMQAEGMDCDFVGHPVVSEAVASDAQAQAFREANGLGDAPIVLALPGSRRGEVGRLMPVFGEAMRAVLAKRPEARIVIPVAAPVASAVAEAAKNWPGAPVLVDPRGKTNAQALADKQAAFKAADVALAASGTVSLELAAAQTPMVVAYDMNWFSYQIISRMAKIDTVTLVNLVSETRVVPEFLGSDCKPAPIAQALVSVLQSPDAQHAAMRLTMERLGKGDTPPGLRAAQAVLDRLKP